MSASAARALPFFAPLLLTAAQLVACSGAETGPVDWHVSQYRGAERRWIPETEFEFTPPTPSRMVILEVSQYPDIAPTDAQRKAAEAWIRAGHEAARRNGWFDYEKATDAGFRLIFQDKTHYANEEFFLDDVQLDPNRPEVLMYYNTAKGQKLAGYMFYVENRGDRGVQRSGPLSVWHYHWWPKTFCMLKGLLPVGIPDESGRCERGQPHDTSPEMIHLWLIEHPQGRFATNMSIPQKLFVNLVKKREAKEAMRSGDPDA